MNTVPGPAQVAAAPTAVASIPAGSTSVNTTNGPITIQLPTQPQPVQAVKSVTYVQAAGGKVVQTQPPTATVVSSTGQPVQVQAAAGAAGFQPVKLAAAGTTQYAYTTSGEGGMWLGN